MLCFTIQTIRLGVDYGDDVDSEKSNPQLPHTRYTIRVHQISRPAASYFRPLAWVFHRSLLRGLAVAEIGSAHQTEKGENPFCPGKDKGS